MSNQVCPQARREAIASSADVPLPPLPDDATVDQIRPRYYGQLAKVVEPIVERGLKGRLEMNRLMYLFHGIHSTDSFGKLHMDIACLFNRTIGTVLDETDEPTVTALTDLHKRLLQRGGTKFLTVDQQLNAGGATAAEATTSHLEYLYQFIGKTAIPDRIGVLRRSHKQLIGHASVSVDQLGFIRQLRTTDDWPTVTYHTERRELRYETKLTDCPLTDAQKSALKKQGQPDAGMVGDITSPHSIIGCPMLLRPPLVRALWNRTIDWALERELMQPEA